MAITLGFSVPKEPGFYLSVDSSQAGVAGRAKSKILMLGQKLSSGTAEADVPIFVPNEAAAIKYFGQGSMLDRMFRFIKKTYPAAEVWACPQSDPTSGAAANGTITISGTATSTGLLVFYIGGQTVKVVVTSGDTANTIAANIVSAILAQADLPVTASASGGTVTLTAKHKGTCGNEIDVRLNHYGSVAGEVIPNGITVTIIKMSGGTGTPDITAALSATITQEYDVVINPYLSSDAFSKLKDYFAEKWSPYSGVYGHGVSAIIDTYTNLTDGANGRYLMLQNDPHMTVLAAVDIPNPYYELAAAFAGLTAQYQMDADNATLAQGFTSLLLRGILAPKPQNELSNLERDILLSLGYGTVRSVGGSVYLSRARTTYLRDQFGNPDEAYYDQRTLAILQRIIRSDRAEFLRTFAGAVLVNDASSVGGGVKVVSPKVIRGWFAARYQQYMADGLVTDLDRFLHDLIIEIDSYDPNRLNIIYPPQLSGWLAVTGVRTSFRLI